MTLRVLLPPDLPRPVDVPSRLAADVYLDLRHPTFAWFEQLGLIHAAGAEVVVEPGVLKILLILAGVRA